MTMLFSKRINEITYEDVFAFCKEGHEEGIRLDYKLDWPRDLAKVMAAMANTFGGLILIGVDGEDRKPKLPIAGMKFTSKEQLSQKVASIAFDAIYPSLFPEIAVCDFTKGRAKKANRSVVVIRVHESHETPHAVENGTKVYLRVADQTKPQIIEKLADIDTLQWLLNKRERAIELRERLIEDAVTRFRNYCAELAIQKRPDQLESLREHGTDNLKSLFLVVATFPRDPLMSVDKLYGWGRYPGEAGKALGGLVNYERPVPIPGGVKIIESVPKPGHPYVELNQFGLFCSFMEYKERNGTSLVPNDLGFHIHHSLQIASTFYEMLGFQGSLLLKVELTEALWKTLVVRPRMKFTAYQPTILAFERQLYVMELHEEGDRLFAEICKSIFWAFGWKAPAGELERPKF